MPSESIKRRNTLNALYRYFEKKMNENFIGNVQINFSKLGIGNINENKSIKLEGDDNMK